MHLSITTVTIVYRLSTVVVQKEGETRDARVLQERRSGPRPVGRTAADSECKLTIPCQR